MKGGASIGGGQVAQHVLHERWFEDGVRRGDAHAGVGEAELDLASIYRIEDASDEALLDEPAHGERHRGRSDAEVVGEIGEHRRRVGVEMVENAHLSRAHLRAGLGIANVLAVAGEVDARVVTEYGGNVGGEAHAARYDR